MRVSSTNDKPCPLLHYTYFTTCRPTPSSHNTQHVVRWLPAPSPAGDVIGVRRRRGRGNEVSCPNILPIAWMKINWFCPNYTPFCMKLLFEKIIGGQPPPPPRRMARTPIMVCLPMYLCMLWIVRCKVFRIATPGHNYMDSCFSLTRVLCGNIATVCTCMRICIQPNLLWPWKCSWFFEHFEHFINNFVYS